MPDRPRVDVGVLTWNTAELTTQALRRLLDSDQNADIRLLVRDNASTDGTVAVLRERVPEADIDAGTRNVGFAAGVNTLIKRSTAPWLFLLNSDAWPTPGAIGRLVETAIEHPRAAAIVPRIEHPDGSVQHTTHPFPSVHVASTMAFRRDKLTPDEADALFLEGAWDHDRPRRLDWAHAAAWLLPRAALDEIGGLDERFFFYAEDLEWCWRAHKRGFEIWFEPRAIVQHVANASGEQLLAGARDRAHLHNSLRFYAREHGVVSAAAWWSIGTLGIARRFLAARRSGETGRAAVLKRYLAAQLAAPFTKERRPDDSA